MSEVVMLEHHEKLFRKLAKKEGTPQEIARQMISKYGKRDREFYGLNNEVTERIYLQGIEWGISSVRNGLDVQIVEDGSGIRDMMCMHCIQKDNPTDSLCVHYRHPVIDVDMQAISERSYNNIWWRRHGEPY